MKQLLARLIKPSATDGDVLTTVTGKAAWAAPTGGGATSLDGLSDVDTTTTAPSDGQTLVFNAASGLWVPGTISGAIPAGGTKGQVLTKISNTDGDVGWQTPSGGATTTPTIVGETLGFVNGSSVTVAYPAGLQAGDALILFTSHGWVPALPAGYTQLNEISGTNVNGLTAGRTAVAGDVGGSVTVTYNGSFQGEVAVVAVRGANVYDDIRAVQAASGTSIKCSIPGRKADLLLLWCGTRASSTTLTADQGTLVAQRNADSSAGQALYSKTDDALFSGSVNWSASSSTSGFYAASVALGG